MNHLTHSMIHKTDDVLEAVKDKDVIIEERPKNVILTNAHTGDVMTLPKTTHLSKSQAYRALVFLGRLLVLLAFMLILRVGYIAYTMSTCPPQFNMLCEKLFW